MEPDYAEPFVIPEADEDEKVCDVRVGCGEPIATDCNGFYVEEVGEFWWAEQGQGVLLHAQCGLDQGMELA